MQLIGNNSYINSNIIFVYFTLSSQITCDSDFALVFFYQSVHFSIVSDLYSYLVFLPFLPNLLLFLALLFSSWSASFGFCNSLGPNDSYMLLHWFRNFCVFYFYLFISTLQRAPDLLVRSFFYLSHQSLDFLTVAIFFCIGHIQWP